MTGALARLVGERDRFLAQHWNRSAHLRSGADVARLLGVDEVDHILSTMALRAPAFRVVKAGVTLDQAAYTRRARIGSRTVHDLIDVGRVYGHFDDGATIVLQGLHRYWPAVADLCRSLESELTHPVQANAYITPPVSQGLRVHADAHDVFAVQTHGHKQWVLYEGDQDPGPDGSGGTPTMDVRLGPGDCLYVPKGAHHAARTVDSASIHLTLGVRTTTWADVLRGVVDGALDDPVLAGALPAGFAHDPAGLADDIARRLTHVAERVSGADADAVARRAARRFHAGRVPSLTGQLLQLLLAGGIDDATTVRPRPTAVADVAVRDGRLVIAMADRALRLPAAAEPAVAQLLDGATHTVGDLAGHLDEAGRRALVTRLVREGLLMVADG